MARKKDKFKYARMQYGNGYSMVAGHRLFTPLLRRVLIRVNEYGPGNAWGFVDSVGIMNIYLDMPASASKWAYVVAHNLLHMGLGHFDHKPTYPHEWNVACDLIVARFLEDFKLGAHPDDRKQPGIGAGQTEQSLYERFVMEGIPDHLRGFGLAGLHGNDMVWKPPEYVSAQRSRFATQEPEWTELFGVGLRQAVNWAVMYASGENVDVAENAANSEVEKARRWFINAYPLLGALAANFDIIETIDLCHRMNISIAAVNAEAREIYVNPSAGLTQQELRFVIAHELLHVGLRHHARRQGRDPYLWNVACDYVINGWLVEMDVGRMPPIGALHDPALKDLSAEAIYDRIANDLRRYRKLATLRGKGLGDMLDGDKPDWWLSRAGYELDDFYRRSLAQGLVYHQNTGRGLLPAGLVEEIRALSQPPVPWDVELAQWFDANFPPLEKRRTYARPSRRQSSTPDIPRPRWVTPPPDEASRTFGVVLDTSGSMNRTMLGKALGAIASYSMAHDVTAVRVIYCDAEPYDAGYVAPESLTGKVKVKGRGGTVLQPAIELLQKSGDFPEDGPILIITDGITDRLYIKREHAFLVPLGYALPFRPRGPVFYVS